MIVSMMGFPNTKRLVHADSDEHKYQSWKKTLYQSLGGSSKQPRQMVSISFHDVFRIVMDIFIQPHIIPAKR